MKDQNRYHNLIKEKIGRFSKPLRKGICESLHNIVEYNFRGRHYKMDLFSSKETNTKEIVGP